jgi:hypothetical protein
VRVVAHRETTPATKDGAAMHLDLTLRTAAAAACLSLPWVAAAAQPPKEGTLDFNFCFAGTVEHSEISTRLSTGSFQSLAALHSNPAGGAFDRQGARCFGTYAFVDGKHLGVGYCVHVDPDGDRWLQKWEAGADFTGTWSAMGGTGKYDGMQASGRFKPINFVASALPNSVQHCNHNTGSYRLK